MLFAPQKMTYGDILLSLPFLILSILTIINLDIGLKDGHLDVLLFISAAILAYRYWNTILGYLMASVAFLNIITLLITFFTSII